MTWYWIIANVVGYLLVGGAFARRRYVAVMDGPDPERYWSNDKYQYVYPTKDGQARKQALLSLFFWPISTVGFGICLISRGFRWVWRHTIAAPTPGERRRQLEQEQEKTRQLVAKHDLTDPYGSPESRATKIDRIEHYARSTVEDPQGYL